MEVKMNFSQMDIFNFLKKKGYQIQAYVLQIEAEESMLLSEPIMEINTFTATKNAEPQNANNLYLNAFETELKELLKEFKQTTDSLNVL